MANIARFLTVAQWQAETGATGEPDGADGHPLSAEAKITVSPNGEEYCVGYYDGNQTWMRFDGAAVEGDETGGWTGQRTEIVEG